MWFESATFLVRRVDEQAGPARRTTLYRPEVNKEIPVNALEFNAPATQ